MKITFTNTNPFAVAEIGRYSIPAGGNLQIDFGSASTAPPTAADIALLQQSLTLNQLSCITDVVIPQGLGGNGQYVAGVNYTQAATTLHTVLAGLPTVITNSSGQTIGITGSDGSAIAFGGIINSKSIPDGITINTSTIQYEIDSLSAGGGGTLNFKPGIHKTGPLNLKANVVITGIGAVLKNTSYGIAITSTGLSGAVVRDITLSATGDGTSNYECGIKAVGGAILVYNVTFDRYNDEALYLDSNTIACKVINCYAGNSAMNYARTSRTGVFRIGGTDHQFINNEIGSAQNWLPPATAPGNGWMSITSTNLYNCGYFITAANCFFLINRAQNLDVGWWVDSSSNGLHRFDSNRGDCCWAHSFINQATNNVIVNHFAEDVCLQGTGLYSAVKTTGQNNRYSNCHGRATNRNYGPTYAITYPSYAYEDGVSAGEVYQKNAYSNCQGVYNTALALTNSWEGSNFQDPSLSTRKSNYPTLDSNGTTFIVLVHTAAGTVTDIVGDTNGKMITLLPQSSFAITIQKNSRIQTKTGADIVLSWGNPVHFISYNGVWFQYN